jgi:hypothetical protein
MRKHLSRSIPLLGGLLLLAPGAALAQGQLLVFDVSYEANSMTTHNAHYDVKPLPDQPANWKSPIDYTAGTAYMHLEVMTKPSDLPTQIDVCFDGDLAGYGCISTDLYTTTGVHETVAKLSTMWQFDKVAWTKKRTLYQLVIKDKNNVNGGNPPTAFLPTKVRMVFTIVPPGGTYVPPTAGTMAADAGAAVDAMTVDAAARAPDVAPTAPPATPPDAAPPAARSPPVTTPDAATSPPPKMDPPKMDPPKTDPPATDPGAGDDTPPPKKAAAKGACAIAGGEPGALLPAGLALLILARRRRR